MRHHTIGQLAKLTGNTVVTLRYYEKLGLLGKVQRSEGGFRLYPDGIISRLHFIHNAKTVGFSLDEIKQLLDLQNKKAPSQAIKNQTKVKLELINDKLKTLTQIKEVLTRWEQACDGKVPIDRCPILANLYKEPGS